MKTLIVLLALATASISLNAQKSQPTYVITKNDTIFFKKLNEGVYNMKGVTVSNQKVSIPNHEVLAYSNHGKRMDKMPLYLDNKNTGNYVMMELVFNTSKIRVFKYEYYNALMECTDAIFSFYTENQCIQTQINPNLAQIKNTILEFKVAAQPLLTSE